MIRFSIFSHFVAVNQIPWKSQMYVDYPGVDFLDKAFTITKRKAKKVITARGLTTGGS